MSSDITLSYCAEDSITYRVQEHIGIRMAEEALWKGHLHPSNYEPPSFHKPMDIITKTNAHNKDRYKAKG